MVEYRIRMHPGDNRPDALWEQIPDDHAVRVGRFMAAWSLIEFKLECIIWNLIGGDRKFCGPLTARLDAQPKQETIDELLVTRRLCPEQMEAWAAAKQAIGGLRQHRNSLAHGVWLPIPFEITGVLSTRKGGIRKGDRKPYSVVLAQIKPIEIDDLDGWIAEAGEAVRNLNLLLPEGSDDGSTP